MNKITIVGCPASGKTTLANRLGILLDIPVHHLDKLFWVEKGGIKQDVFIKQQEEIMRGNKWIIDGNFWRSKSFDLRLEKADTIILFSFEKYIIYYRLFKRIVKNYGKTRPDMPENSFKEKFDWKLIKYIWNYSVEESLNKVVACKENKNVFILRTPRDEKSFYLKLNNFLNTSYVA